MFSEISRCLKVIIIIPIQWFNKNCNEATQERNKAKSSVVMKSSVENKRRLVQKQREIKRILKREKKTVGKTTDRSHGEV